MHRIEQTIIKSLIYDENFTRAVLPFISDEYFFDYTEKVLFKQVQEYVNKYGSNPTHESIIINLTESKDLSEDVVGGAIEILNEMYKERDTIPELDWMVENTEKFCQDRAIHNAIRDAVNILDGGDKKRDKGEIPKLLSDALATTFDSNIGHDYLSDVEERFETYNKKEDRIPFDLDIFNKITRGGLPKKTLNVALAGCVHPETKVKIRFRK